MNELIMTSLRTVKGLDLNQVKILFGTQMENQLITQAADYRLKGWMSTDPTKLALTSEGMKFCDLITASLFKN
jgi:coproporphyrinogen III oxidase-like Fe-S oxidoreductase